jgi:hypothetical protein
MPYLLIFFNLGIPLRSILTPASNHIFAAMVALPAEAMLRHICRCKALIRAAKTP